MILSKAVRYLEVEPLLAGLQKAANGVVYLWSTSDGKRQYRCTGWLITDTLLVNLVMNLSEVTKRGEYLTGRPSLMPEIEVEANLFYTAPKGGEVFSAPFDTDPYRDSIVPVVMQLSRPIPGRSLTLAVKAAEMGEQVYILHHPRGTESLTLSPGEITFLEGQSLGYDADTEPGSSGAPVFNRNWEVVGIHFGGGSQRRFSGDKQQQAPAENFNEGLSVAALLAALRPTPAWAEIAAYHKLADLPPPTAEALISLESASPRQISTALLRAAVLWSFDPKQFAAADVEQLRPLVSDPSRERWSLRADERQRLLKSADSPDELRTARGEDAVDDPGQRVIDRILQGPPFDLDEVADESLPHWLQAVRWFAGVVPSLPTPKEIYRTLEYRRIRGRLREIVGPNFRGREDELARLKAWCEDVRLGPITVTGIGGVGKSALVSKFALELPAETIILWLDFDRADIAPDDAVSVLNLLSEQAAMQIDGYTAPVFDEAKWEEGARAFGDALAAVGGTPLLVLDGFEMAQYVQQYQEIWLLLETILKQAPALRVLVSGRAAVPNLVLAGRPTLSLNLIGLSRPHTEAWLRDIGIDDPAIMERVYEISNGVPLILLLVTQWLKAGGDMRELPDKLPEAIVEGYLYQRILDRVIDPALKPVARDALVLRRLTVEVIAEVLSEDIPEGLDAQEVYNRLERELALIRYDVPGLPIPSAATTSGGVLHLRPEVRAATLRQLESDDLPRVRAVDQRAAAWYARQNLDETIIAAELVYHYLRLGDVAAAQKAWRDDHIPLLLHAEDDLPEDALDARAWLRERLGDSDKGVSLEAWEQDALGRIRDALGRQLLRAVPAILAERPDRSPASPLVLYDAWERRQSGDRAGARALLKTPETIAGPVDRDRAALAALLAVEDGDLDAADRLLAMLEPTALWSDWKQDTSPALAVTAARVGLTVTLEAELALAGALADDSPSPLLRLADAAILPAILPAMTGGFAAPSPLARLADAFLPTADVLLPSLAARIGVKEGSPLEGLDPPKSDEIEMPASEHDLERFQRELDEARRDQNAQYGEAFARVALPNAGEALMARFIDDSNASIVGVTDLTAIDSGKELAALVAKLAYRGWRRWRIVSTGLFLVQACEELQRSDVDRSLMSLSLLGTLGLFQRTEHNSITLLYRGNPLNIVLDQVTWRTSEGLMLMPTRRRAERAAEVIGRLVEAGGSSATPFYRQLHKALQQALSSEPNAERITLPFNPLRDPGMAQKGQPDLMRANGIALYLLCPDPLEVLIRQIIGLPLASTSGFGSLT